MITLRRKTTIAAVAVVVLAAAAVIAVAVSSGGGGTRTHPSRPAPAVRLDCLAAPSRCGFPDATDTGVPPGTKLTTSDGLVLSTPGQVVTGLDIAGCVSITASDVRLENSKVHGNCGGSAEISVAYSGVSDVVIDHVEIDGGRSTPSAVGVKGAGFTLRAVDIHGTGDGVDLQNDDHVLDSYIHDLYVAADDHTDGIQSSGGDGSTVEHTTVVATCAGCNSAMLIGADLGDIGTFTADQNLLDGGGFTVYAGTGGFDSGVIRFTANRFGPGFGYGACTFKPSAGRTITFTGNVDDATGKPVSC